MLDPSNPPKKPKWEDYNLQHSFCQPHVEMLVRRIHTLMDSYPNKRFTLGEVLSGRKGGKESLPLASTFVGQGKLDICYTGALVDLTEYPTKQVLKDIITGIEGHFPSNGGNCNTASNHDRPRSASRMTEGVPNAYKPQAIRQLMQLSVCLPGSFTMYQGEELGLPQARVPEDIPLHQLKDPVATTLGIQYGRDGCRTPMPWKADAKNAGFGDSDNPYLPVPQSHVDLAVDRQEIDRDSMLKFTRTLLAWRKAQPALTKG